MPVSREDDPLPPHGDMSEHLSETLADCRNGDPPHHPTFESIDALDRALPVPVLYKTPRERRERHRGIVAIRVNATRTLP